MRANREFKILNDPIYGLIDIPKGIIWELMEHRFFQRLRRIYQLGFTHFVYPGATHTRFNHCLGAMHLMRHAIRALRSKGVQITNEEAEAVTIAILLHDLGHGPFSHSLEHQIVDVDHEQLSLMFMKELNEEFDGRLTLAIQIFQNKYHKKFLYQLISGQLDMDRLDYLTRDSFFTGVVDGKVSFDRILKTLDVHEDNLVVEFKGIYSIENFLMARRLMYWQVYLHKNVICAGEMLTKVIERARYLIGKGVHIPVVSSSLQWFLTNTIDESNVENHRQEVLQHFYNLDDTDVLMTLKVYSQYDDFVLSYLSKNLIERRLLKIDLRNFRIGQATLDEYKQQLSKIFKGLSEEEMDFLVFEGKETNRAYKLGKTEIQIKLENNSAKPISQWKEHSIQKKQVVKYFACYPKLILKE